MPLNAVDHAHGQFPHMDFILAVMCFYIIRGFVGFGQIKIKTFQTRAMKKPLKMLDKQARKISGSSLILSLNPTFCCGYELNDSNL